MSVSSKICITPAQLRQLSFQLAKQVVDSEWHPDYLIALWRGGAPIGCYVHEFFKYHNIHTDHVAIRTSRFTGIGEANEMVQVHSASYVTSQLKDGDKVLIVDDVWDSGKTMMAVHKHLRESTEAEFELRTACVHFKPKANVTGVEPEYFVSSMEPSDWLVYPHELEGMTKAEVEQTMGTEVARLLGAPNEIL